MSRSVDEWIGKDHDTPIPKRVKLRVLIAHGGKCWKSGHKFRPGDRIEYDHKRALCNAPPGENWNRESNIGPILGGKVHNDKSAKDREERDKTNRMYLKNLGQWPEPVRKLQGRGFQRRAAPGDGGSWPSTKANSGRTSQ